MTFPSALGPPARLLRRRIGTARRDTAFLAAGVLPHLAAVPAWLSLDAKPVLKSVHLPWVVLAALVSVFLLLPLLALPLTAVQRWRYAELLAVDIPRSPPAEGPRLRRALRLLVSAETWRRVAYHTLLGPVLAVAEVLVLAVWGAGVVCATVYAWMWAVPDTGVADLYTVQAAYVTAAGLLLLAAAPWCAGTVTRVESRAARALLGPSRAQRLERRVTDLSVSRADLADAADAERRRIERDLHDGTQQRLVSLAVNLGLARATLKDLPEDARRVIDEAHREAKEAISELNDLVRGLHPAVLDDRGLDAALSGLAARVPLPVRLHVDLDGRPAPAVESVAYFVVSEALANVTKHARAGRVEVTVRRTGRVVRVEVTDDGVGGADAAAGTGLTGLAGRVRAVDGTFRIDSPVGGPTTLVAELPCGR
ncbi:sensor histidine kinase [Streptomyces griseorubiginosus]|uniref:sensor histidine kinase n=1 Tax=Streptomyces griseorubiginosus TaxID=67304 RepID=UPI001AD623B4|nr:histidine kinase [Streptomyces griseorubiginosus]MBO4257464.1 sensor histidine kinase [Streptomyces griseorubiginosus]